MTKDGKVIIPAEEIDEEEEEKRELEARLKS